MCERRRTAYVATMTRPRQFIVGTAALCVVATASLAACSPSASAPPSGSASSAGATAAGTPDCGPATTCYSPQQLEVAYGVKPLRQRGIDGRGETVVLPELAETQLDPPLVTDLRQDVAGYDDMFHLPAARMRVVTTLAGASFPWLAFGEEVLDVELVHALAPDANLVILLLPSKSLDSTPNAVAAAIAELRLGSALGSVMSISAAGQIGGEHCVSRAQAGTVNAAVRAAVDRGMTVVAASGDIGAAAYQCDLYSALTGTPPAAPAKGVLLLASDPFVLSAGGTSLTVSHATGAWTGETAWGLASGNAGNQGGSFQASGGGFSQLFARPGYQAGVLGIGAARGVPDVSADASDRTGVAVVFRNGTHDTVQSHGGTSAAAPIWAALVALADQYAGHHLGFINRAIYQIARGSQYRQAFHDITTGTNTVQFPPITVTGYRAGPGWDPVTGWGSPDAQVLVPLIASYASR
jgi:subtilase family serine protease